MSYLFIFNVFQMQTGCLFIVNFSKIRIEILILVEVCVLLCMSDSAYLGSSHNQLFLSDILR